MFRSLVSRSGLLVGRRLSSSATVPPLDLLPFGGAIQYLSDLHLDYGYWRGVKQAPRVQAEAPYLVLAGDLGRVIGDRHLYGDFLQGVCRDFERVILVPGNHEYYDADMFEVDFVLEQFQQELRNLSVLNNNRCGLELPDGKWLTVLGTTLWSKCPEESQETVELEQRMADYRRTKIMGHDLLISDTNQMLEDNCRFLLEWRIEQEYLHENDRENEDLLVVSHHAPLIEQCCDPRYLPIDRKTGKIDRMKWVNYCFASDLGNLIQFLAPQAWIFGHTHYRTAFDYHGTVVASNPVGRLEGGEQLMLDKELVQVL